jgi:prepilin-type N-terminal cleavage/methylation domain-containing protein
MKKIHDVKHPRPIRKSGERGFSLIELLIVVAIILSVAAIGIPKLLAAKRASNETAGVAELKTLAENASTYQAHQRVFPSLAAAMGGAETANTVAAGCTTGDDEYTTAQALAWDAGFQKSGYNFLFLAGGTTITSALGCAGNDQFEATAIPITVGNGSVSYCVDVTGEYMLSGVGTPTSGGGCKTDGYSVALQ